MRIEIAPFQGETPRTQERYLPDGFATLAESARLNRGDLEPMRQPVTVDALGAAAERFYLYGSTMIPLPASGDAVPGPVALDRLYITRGAVGVPQLLYSGVYYDLTVPTPVAAPGVSRAGTLDPELTETTLYAFTWVTDLAEESAPSPASANIQWSPGNTITISIPAAAPAGRRITIKRIYRLVTSASGATDLFFVANIAAGVASFVDTYGSAISEPIATKAYAPPPAALEGLTAMPNGMMAGFVGRDLYFCEPYRPHAWPIGYSLTVGDPIVGLAAFGSSLAILTTGFPYVAQGIRPDAMVMERVEVNLPCVSKRSIVDLGYAAIYASTDGLVQMSQQGAQVLSSGVWTREQFQRDITPSTIRAGRYDGRYVFSYQPGGIGARLTGAVELAQQPPSFIRITGESYLDFYAHVETGRLLGLDINGTTIRSYDDIAGARKTLTWRSKPFRLPADVSFGAILVDAGFDIGQTPALSVQITADGTVVATSTIFNQIDRLPAALGKVWQMTITTNCTLTRVVLAGNPDEIIQ